MAAAAKISVIIPTLNEAGHIAKVLSSLGQQPAIEVIISDGGSTDSTVDICQQYPVRVITGQAGRGSQLNRGAEVANGQVLLFLHADSVVGQAVFDQIQQAVKKGAKWGCASLTFDDNGLFFEVLAFFSNLRARVLSSCYGDQGIWCEYNCFFAAGGFPDYPLMEDLAFSQGLRRRCRATVVPGKIITSARRFKAGNPLGVWMKMQYLKLCYHLGMSPDQLAAKYQ